MVNLKRSKNQLVLALTLTLLAACSSGGGAGDMTELSGDKLDNTPPDPGHTSNDRDSYPAGLGCGWEIASNIDTMNIAFPDESAKYWVAMVPMLPQTRLRIDGYYPDARYFSYNVYDPLLRPTDAIAYSEVIPNEGSRNSAAEEDAAWGDSYTAYVEFSGKPEEPAANTIYAGEFPLGPQAIPQPVMTALFYRIYVPGEDKEFDGGVGLPLLTLETADGEQEIVPTANCVEPLLPTMGGQLPPGGLNDVLETIGFPDQVPSNLPFYLGVGDPKAETKVFYGLPSTVFNLASGFLGLPIPPEVEQGLPLPAGGGFLSNIHNAYSTNLFSRSYGNIAIIRAKAPTYRSGDGVAFGDEQLRFWSVCQNDLPTQRYVGCYADHQMTIGSDGYFTVLVSDEEDRPANATADNAVNWLAWGPYVDSLVIYRHMLPHPDFAEAVQNVPKGTPPADIMGDYVSRSAYCTTEIVEAAGSNPADIFAACREYTEGLSAWGVK